MDLSCPLNPEPLNPKPRVRAAHLPEFGLEPLKKLGSRIQALELRLEDRGLRV